MERKRKEEEGVGNLVVNDVSKQRVLDDLKDSLLELSEKRKSGCAKASNPSWRDMFKEEDE